MHPRCWSKRGSVCVKDSPVISTNSIAGLPQNWFEDFGNGHLSSGLGKVTVDSIFAQTVNLDSDYHVFLTPEGECRGLYVTNKTPSGFEVHEIGSGRSNVAFDYRIVALRRGYENVRLADMTEQLKKINAQAPMAPTGPRFKPPRRLTPALPVVPAQLTAPAIPANQAVVTLTKSAPGSSSN